MFRGVLGAVAALQRCSSAVMNSNIDQHINWAKENCNVAFNGFPTPRLAQRSDSQQRANHVAYDFSGKTQLEAMLLESSNGAAAINQSRSGGASLSVVGLQELQKCQAVLLQRAMFYPPSYFYFLFRLTGIFSFERGNGKDAMPDVG